MQQRTHSEHLNIEHVDVKSFDSIEFVSEYVSAALLSNSQINKGYQVLFCCCCSMLRTNTHDIDYYFQSKSKTTNIQL